MDIYKVRAKIDPESDPSDIYHEDDPSYTYADYARANDMPFRNGKLYGYITGNMMVGDVIDASEEYIIHEWWQPILLDTVERPTNEDDIVGKPLYEGDKVIPVSHVPGDLDVTGSISEIGGVITWLEGGWFVLNSDIAVPLWQETLKWRLVGDDTDEA